MAEHRLSGNHPASNPSSMSSQPAFERRLAVTIASVLIVVSTIWAAEVARLVGLPVLPEQYAAFCLALAFGLVFIAVRRDRSRGGAMSWDDIALAVVGSGVALYTVVVFPGLVQDIFYRRTEAGIIGVVLTIVTLEAMRRVVGPGLAILTVMFMAYAWWGYLIPGWLQAQYVASDMLVGYLALGPDSLIGRPLVIVSSIVIPFIVFGQLFTICGGAAFMTDLSTAIAGRSRGGAAKVAVLSSGMFGSISGSVVSNVMSTGAFTIPMMRRSGFPAHTAAAIEAVASTGGQLMPPVMGAAAFYIAEFLRIDYIDVVVAAIVPAVLYYVALLIQADLFAARLDRQAVDAEADLTPAWPILKAGWHFLLPPAAIVISLISWNATPQWSALAGSFLVLVLGMTRGYQGRRVSPRALFDGLVRTANQATPIVVAAAGAGILIGSLQVSGLAFGFGLHVSTLSASGTFFVLLATAGACIVLGMGLPTSAVYILLATLLAPGLISLGIVPIAAHLFVFYFGMMSMITPPVAFGAFAAASLAETGFLKTAWTAMRFGWAAYILPFIFVYTPALILQGTVWEIAFSITCAATGVWAISAALAGYFSGPLSKPGRAMLAFAGLLVLYPDFSSTIGVATSCFGLVVGIGTLGYESGRYGSAR